MTGADSALATAVDEVLKKGRCVFAPSCEAWLAEHPRDPFRLWAIGATAEEALGALGRVVEDHLIRKGRAV